MCSWAFKHRCAIFTLFNQDNITQVKWRHSEFWKGKLCRIETVGLEILAGMKKSGFCMNIPGTFKSMDLTFFLQYKFYIDTIYSNFLKSCYSEMLRMQVNRIMSFKSFKTVLPAKNISLQYRNDHYLSFQCYFPGFSWPLSVLELLVRHFWQFLCSVFLVSIFIFLQQELNV